MVISFEEKDRAAIESTGMTIIEFKRILYKVNGCFEKIWEAAKKAAETIIDAFKKAFADPIKAVAKKIGEAIEDIANWYQNLPEVERHKIVKWYAKANNPAMIARRGRAYHCRDNC